MTFNQTRYLQLRGPATIGARVHHQPRTTSTMDDARAGAEAGNPPGDAYLADEQDRGRGRFDRRWHGAPGAALAVTFHLRLPTPEGAPLLAAAGALAAGDALDAAAGLPTDLKWPNDVLHEGRKLVGVLAESRPAARALDIFLGIGINLDDRALSALPPEVRARATSIEAAGSAVPSREALLAALAAALERWLDAHQRARATLLDAWRARLGTLGARVRLDDGTAVIEGDALDVDEHGALLLRLDDGTTRAFAAGEVTTAR